MGRENGGVFLQLCGHFLDQSRGIRDYWGAALGQFGEGLGLVGCPLPPLLLPLLVRLELIHHMLLVLSRLDRSIGGLTQDTAAIGILELLKDFLVKEPPGGVLLLVEGLIRLVLLKLLLWRLLVDPCHLQLSHLLIAFF